MTGAIQAATPKSPVQMATPAITANPQRLIAPVMRGDLINNV